jgi:hypothetical protein
MSYLTEKNLSYFYKNKSLFKAEVEMNFNEFLFAVLIDVKILKIKHLNNQFSNIEVFDFFIVLIFQTIG